MFNEYIKLVISKFIVPYKLFAASRSFDASLYPWWAVDLGEAFIIDYIRLTNRVDCCCEFKVILLTLIKIKILVQFLILTVSKKEPVITLTNG